MVRHRLDVRGGRRTRQTSGGVGGQAFATQLAWLIRFDAVRRDVSGGLLGFGFLAPPISVLQRAANVQPPVRRPYLCFTLGGRA